MEGCSGGGSDDDSGGGGGGGGTRGAGSGGNGRHVIVITAIATPLIPQVAHVFIVECEFHGIDFLLVDGLPYWKWGAGLKELLELIN